MKDHGAFSYEMGGACKAAVHDVIVVDMNDDFAFSYDCRRALAGSVGIAMAILLQLSLDSLKQLGNLHNKIHRPW